MEELERLKVMLGDLLTGVGLDPRAGDAYVALMSGVGEDERSLAETLDLDRDRTTRLVAGLLDLELVRRDHDRPARLVAVPLEGPLTQLLSRLEEDLGRRTTSVAHTRRRAHEAGALFERLWGNDPLAMLELGTSSEVVNFLHRMRDDVRSEVCALVTNRPSAHALSEALEADLALLAKGVTLRLVYPVAVRADPSLNDYVRTLRHAGASVRYVPVVPVRTLIYDRSVAVVAADPDELTQGAVVARNRGLLAALTWAFDQLWDQAEEDEEPASGLLATRAEREALRLFAQGMKDDAVARRMGVSVRTLRRMIAQLSDRLGVSSRFELGMRAAALGWVRPSAACSAQLHA